MLGRGPTRIGPYPAGLRPQAGLGAPTRYVPLACRLLPSIEQGARARVGWAGWPFVATGCCDRLPYVASRDAWASVYGAQGQWVPDGGRLAYVPPVQILDIEGKTCQREAFTDACNRPADVPGRIEAFDHVRQVDQVQTLDDDGNPTADLEGVELAVEVGRVIFGAHATAILERVATWLRVDFFTDPETAAGSFEFSTNDPVPGSTRVASPFPFPFAIDNAHPTVRASWALKLQGIADASAGALPAVAAPLGGAPSVVVPSSPSIVTRWSDMRYVWGSRYTEGHDWVMPGGTMLRLFCILNVSALDGDSFVRVSVGSRLAGYHTAVSRMRSALRAATQRT